MFSVQPRWKLERSEGGLQLSAKETRRRGARRKLSPAVLLCRRGSFAGALLQFLLGRFVLDETGAIREQPAGFDLWSVSSQIIVKSRAMKAVFLIALLALSAAPAMVRALPYKPQDAGVPAS